MQKINTSDPVQAATDLILYWPGLGIMAFGLVMLALTGWRMWKEKGGKSGVGQAYGIAILVMGCIVFLIGFLVFLGLLTPNGFQKVSS